MENVFYQLITKEKNHVLFIIVDSNNTVPIHGLKTSERLNLVRRVFKVNTSELEDDADFFCKLCS